MTAGRPAASLPAGRPAASLPAGRPAATLPARHRAATTTARRPAATLVALALVLTGCAPAATTITSTGRVQTDTVSVQAPSLSVPKVNLNAGFAVTATTAANLSLVPTLLGFGSAQRVSAVEVALGEQVKAGDVLVRFDDAALAANVTAAKADLALAKTQVGVIDAAIDTTHDKESDLVDARKEVRDGIEAATKARKQLRSKLAQARTAAKELPAQLSKVEKQIKELTGTRAALAKKRAGLSADRASAATKLAEVEATLAALPPDAPPSVRDPLLAAQKQLQDAIAAMDAGLAQMKAGLAQLDAGLGKLKAARVKLKAAITQVNEGIPQLTKAIKTVDTNLAKAHDGLKKIDRGIKKIREARADLKRSRKLAVIAADDDNPVRQAQTARNQAVVTAPRAGIVSSIADVGEVVAPGATVAELSAPAHVVQVWLAPAAAAQVCVGDAATVEFGGQPAATVSRILPLAQYPPTFHTTDEVHLTRAVPVEVTADAALPPGVPVDVQLTPCRTNEVKK